MRFPYTMFTLQTCFELVLLKEGGGGGVKIRIEVTVNSKEENSSDFRPNKGPEFGLRSNSWTKSSKKS